MKLKRKDDVDPVDLREMFYHDIDRGVLIWKFAPRNQYLIGRIAGNKNKVTGYIEVMVRGSTYKVHRLIWAHVYGSYPENDIDHIDRDKTNNRLSNLREATRMQNCYNKPANKTNLLGLRGVSITKHGRYRAVLCADGVRKHLGVFATPAEASLAYQAASIERVGEFAYAA